MSTNGNIQGVQWVPGLEDYVVNWSTDLKLYKISIEARDYVYQHNFNLVNEYIVNCPALRSELISRITETPHYGKCMAVCPSAPIVAPSNVPGCKTPSTLVSPTLNSSGLSDVKVAVGQANGKISIMSFYSGGSAIKEFGPKTGRACNDLAWNPKYTNYLAAAYEKNRNDSSILIFDTSLKTSTNVVVDSASTSAMSKIVPNRSSTTKQTKDLIGASIEIGMGETCNSLAWLHKSPETLVAGMNLKNLRIFDIRVNTRSHSNTRPTKSNFTRYTSGVCVDPHMDYRVASYFDDIVVIWDTRNFDKPIWTKTQSTEIVQLAWSPTRSGLLCSLVKGSNDTLMLHDIQSWAVMTEDGEPAVTQRMVNVLPLEYPDPASFVEEDIDIEGKDVITSFAWHPTEENCLVACRKNNHLAEVHVMERISPSWSSQHFLMWPHNGILRSYDKTSSFHREIKDVSVLMQKRAKANCFKPENPPIDPNDKYLGSHIKLAFSWLENCKTLMGDLAFRNQFTRPITLPGIRTAIGLDRGKGSAFVLKSDITYKHWNTGSSLESKNQSRPKRLFKGDARSRALKLCGWGLDEPELMSLVKKLENQGQYERAAAVAVFNLEMRAALQSLERSLKCEKHNENLSTVAMALAGFNEEKVGLWREMVANMVNTLKHPYLRTMFKFLLIMCNWNGSDQETFDDIIGEEALMPTDKLAFACLYLPDEKLSDYINRMWDNVRNQGDISGIYFTGASSNETIDLLQQYVDITGDVQTASWICVLYMPSELLNSREADEPMNWIMNYRNLLTTWGLAHKRSEFDNACQTYGSVKIPMQQVYVSCNFCGKSLAKSNEGLKEMRDLVKQGNAQEMKKVAATLNANMLQKHTSRFQSCSSCRKPMPRCSVCMIHMGSHSGYMIGTSSTLPGEKNKKSGTKITPFGNFFSWCQMCRHGGHANHISEWFEENQECPVSGCQCRCLALDLDKDIIDNTDDVDDFNDEQKENQLLLK